jgi:hypothetical protein
MHELLTQPKTPEIPRQVAGIKSEWWPASNRNGGRHQIGIPGRLPSESPIFTEFIVGEGLYRFNYSLRNSSTCQPPFLCHLSNSAWPEWVSIAEPSSIQHMLASFLD